MDDGDSSMARRWRLAAVIGRRGGRPAGCMATRKHVSADSGACLHDSMTAWGHTRPDVHSGQKRRRRRRPHPRRLLLSSSPSTVERASELDARMGPGRNSLKSDEQLSRQPREPADRTDRSGVSTAASMACSPCSICLAACRRPSLKMELETCVRLGNSGNIFWYLNYPNYPNMCMRLCVCDVLSLST
jgi:hypothetical protein